MGVLMKMGESRAIKKIARNLPPFLVSGYGAGEVYTPGQVATAMDQTGCNCDFIDFAYAMFCTEDAFNEVSNGDYNSLQQGIGDICFGGNSNFSFSDASSFSEGSDGGSGGGVGGGE